jgi:hypothetical protein
MEEYEIGDLVVTYLFNTSTPEPEILHHGIILDVNTSLKDILVLDSFGSSRWWTARRWKILSKAKKK